jgi:hypothetical protein
LALNAVFGQSLVNIRPNAVVSIRPDAIVKINGSLTNNGIFHINGDVTIIGNWTNNGDQFSLQGTVSFIGSGNAQISGTGTTTEFYDIILNKTSANDRLDVLSTAFSANNPFLSLERGIFHIGGTFSFTNNFFSILNYTINSNSGLWLDNENVIFTGQNASLLLQGLLRLTNGTINIGAGANENNLLYESGSSAAQLTVEGGTLNVNARLSRNASDSDSLRFTQSGGTINLGYGSQNTSATRALFDLGSAGSSFYTSAGEIVLKSQASAFANGEFYSVAGASNVTGGTVKIDARNNAETYRLNTTHAIGNLLMTGTNSPIARIINNDLSVVSNITIAGTGAGRFDANNRNITLGGNWINNSTTDLLAFTAGAATVTMNGLPEQRIQGAVTTAFNNLTINKQIAGSDTTNQVVLDTSVTVNGNLRLVSNTLFNINLDSLTIGTNGDIYSTAATTDTSFNNKKMIFNPSWTADCGRIKKLITPDITPPIPPINLFFPIGTYGRQITGSDTAIIKVFTPSTVYFHPDSVMYYPNASVSCKAIPMEHPAVETNNTSLTKYWVMKTENLTFKPIRSLDAFFYYHETEVRGSDADYLVWNFHPSYPDPLGYWQVGPGRTNNIVNWGARFFYSQMADSLNGDWVAGEENIGRAYYYSIKNGDYNDPSTWSKLGFEYTGNPSNTAPNKRSDRVFIRDTVTVSAATAPFNAVIVDKGVVNTVTKTGRLRILGSNFMHGDTLRVGSTILANDGGELDIAHPQGIVLATTKQDSGAVQTIVRSFTQRGTYRFIDSTAALQTTGDALPSPVNVVKIQGGALTDTVKLSKAIIINDSIVINQGCLDVGSYSMDGGSSNRTLKMTGGELLLRTGFPANYAAPTFNAGRVTFHGIANPLIPSSALTPAVNRYYDLKISGSVSGVVTLQSQGEIRIGNSLDISDLTFTGPVSQRFQTNGSTVVFNKNGSTQDIPCRPLAPADTVFNLSYFNLKLDSAGTKRLLGSGTTPVIILNDLTINNNASFESNGFNLEVQRHWVNISGSFNPGTNTVRFRTSSNDPLIPNLITSRDTSANPFYHVEVVGEGYIRPNDMMRIRGNFVIDTLTKFSMRTAPNATLLALKGNWLNQGGTFLPGNSTVSFEGTGKQTMTRTSGNEYFYNMIINGPDSVCASYVGYSSADNGIFINANGNISLLKGNLRTRGRYLQLDSTATITRPGANPGHIDGSLRKIFKTGVQTVVFEVGHNHNYTPLTMTTTGTGGTTGYLNVLSDTIQVGSTPLSWDNTTNTVIQPIGSALSSSKHVARQWSITKPAGSSFNLAFSRTYDATIQYVPTSDLRGGANWTLFEPRLLDLNGNWILPQYLSKPLIGTLTDSTVQYRRLDSLGTIAVGEPGQYSFYSINSGNLSTAANWSTQGYDGPPAAFAPSDPLAQGNPLIFIGNNKSITLDVNLSETYPGIVTIDSTGALYCGSNVISGTGEFRLKRNGALGIGHASGITNAGSGNIQLSTRNYNYGSHFRGHFIYTGTNAQTQANEAVPDSVATLQVNKASNTVTFNKANLVVVDSLYIQSGTLSAGSNLTVNGNWINYGAFTPNNYIVDFNGATADTIKSSAAQTFYQLRLQKTAGNLVIRDNPVTITNLLQFRSGNKGVLVSPTFANYIQINNGATLTRSDSGHVYGQLRRWVGTANPTNVTWHVGTDSLIGYRPITITFNGTGGSPAAGYLAVTMVDGEHPNFGSMPAGGIDAAWLVQRFWRTTKPQGSTFRLGTRTTDINLTFLNPQDLRFGAVPGCFDIDSWANNDWNIFNKTTTQSNFGTNICADRPTGTYTYTGSDVNVKLYAAPASSYGSTLIDTDTLWADFITGRALETGTTTFWSRQDGDWFDVNTWSEVDYDGPPASRVPTQFFDIAYIGNGRRVVLDKSIGSGNRTNGSDRRDYSALRTLNIENNGTLATGTNFIYCFGVNIENNGALEVGSLDGLRGIGTFRGNLWPITYTYYDQTLDNRFIYTAEGYTAPFTPYTEGGSGICTPSGANNSSEWISRIQLPGIDANHSIDNTSGASVSPQAYEYYVSQQANLNAGSSYTLTMTPGFGTTRNQRWIAWIDYNMNGDFTDAGEQLFSATTASSSAVSRSFTVPSGNMPGTTRMRVKMYRSTSSAGSDVCDNPAYGEVEDYSIRIFNPNYTLPAQTTGDGLPANVGAFIVQSPRSGAVNPQVTLSKNVTCADSLKIISGILNAGAYTIGIKGDFINDTIGGFNAQTSEVLFKGDSRDTIRGSQPITFNKITINKPTTTEKVYLENNITVGNVFKFSTDNNLYLNPNNTLTFNATGSVSPDAGSFSSKRMFQVDGISLNDTITKQFSGTTFNFTFPVGVDSIYNPASFNFRGTNSGNAAIKLLLKAEKHPARLTENILSKYWRVSSTGITVDTTLPATYTFGYSVYDINGDVNWYIPGRHKTPGGWEINLGTNPVALPSPITVVQEPGLDGDWTAGHPLVYFNGRVFYSIKSGVWNNRYNWSNDAVLKHSGTAASYYPGMLFNNDTVNIDGHIIVFKDSAHVSIDSLRIGGTNPAAGAGRLLFGDTPSIKTLEMRTLFLDADNGYIGDTSSIANRYDTLKISQDLINLSTGHGINLYKSATNFTALKFGGDSVSTISGNGKWGRLPKVFLTKTGLTDTLINASSTFSLATDTVSNFMFYPNGGVFRHTVADTMCIAKGNTNLTIISGSGFDIRSGALRSDTNIVASYNTTTYLNGGSLIVGNNADECLFYSDGSKFDILSGSIDIAGCFTRLTDGALVNITIDTFGIARVMRIGNTRADRIGFDIRNAGSTFNMDGGRIIVAKGSAEASLDYYVDAAAGVKMRGGIIQSGDSSIAAGAVPIKLKGTMPIFGFHASNAPGNAAQTHFISLDTILNDAYIDVNHTMQIQGNLALGGDLINYGTLSASSAGTLELFGSGNTQTLFNSTGAALEFYNLKIAKPDSGLVQLGLDASDNSNIVVRNNLEFALGNKSLIDSRTFNKYVEVSPSGGSAAEIVINGPGHINGRLYRWIETGQVTKLFPIGNDTLEYGYRPVIFQTTGTGGTAGLVGAISYNVQHPDITNLYPLGRIDNNIQRYWNINHKGGFVLDSLTRSFALTLEYTLPRDTIGLNITLPFLEQFRRTPGWDTIPAAWYITNTTTRTDSTVKSVGNKHFGDFLLAEPEGQSFYSYRDGYWNDVNTWSLTDYLIENTPPANRYPGFNNGLLVTTDKVYIGNGKKVYIPSGLNPQIEVRAVIVENPANLPPGELYILDTTNTGVSNVIYGNTFELQDSCTLGMQRADGLVPVGMPGGGIQTEIRSFGVSRYIFNANNPNYGQTTGRALPDSISALIADNPIQIVAISNFPGAQTLKIRDSLVSNSGVLSVGNRNINLYRNISAWGAATFNPGNASNITFAGSGTKNVNIGNSSGIPFHNLILNMNSGGNVMVNRLNASANANLYVNNQLNFTANDNLITLGDSASIYILNADNINGIVGYGAGKYIKTSQTSGYLVRNMNATGLPKTYTFPVGSFYEATESYAPADFLAQSGAVGGYMGVRTSPGSHPTNLGAHFKISSTPEISYLQRYWVVDTMTSKLNGKLTFNFNLTDTIGTEFVKAGRWRPIKETNGGRWKTFTVADGFSFNFGGSPNFQTYDDALYSDLHGDWTAGSEQAFRRIFYSLRDGLWNDPNSWTYKKDHLGPQIFGSGLWPNEPEDSVVIGGGANGVGNHIITLNVDAPFGAGDGAGVALGTEAANTGTLDCGANTLNGLYFSFGELSTLRIGSTQGISALGGTTGNILTSVSREFNTNGIYEYNGTANQVIGNGLPSTVNSLIINNSGAPGNNTVIIDKNINISSNLSILSGTLDAVSYTLKNITGAGTMTNANGATMRIGGTNNSLFDVITNYSVYDIGISSIFEFYGDNQDVSIVPDLFYNYLTDTGNGYGLLYTTNFGTKNVTRKVLVRSNFVNSLGATVFIDGIDALMVRGNVINSALINNNGVIELGE